MLRKLVCAAVIAVIGIGVVMADEFTATIGKVDGNNVSFKKDRFNPITKTSEQGALTTLPVTADVKITKSKLNSKTNKYEAGETIEDGLKNEIFTKLGQPFGRKIGHFATITTDADNKNITAIRITVFDKSNKNKNEN